MSDGDAAFLLMVLLFIWPALGGALVSFFLGFLGRQGLLWTLIETIVGSAVGYLVFARTMDLMRDPQEAYTDLGKILVVPFFGWELDHKNKMSILLACPIVGGLFAFCIVALMRRWVRLRYNRLPAVTSGSSD